ncbi:MAG: ABC transporter substrate-binding protein [Streptosporangiaceae bacterium]
MTTRTRPHRGPWRRLASLCIGLLGIALVAACSSNAQPTGQAPQTPHTNASGVPVLNGATIRIAIGAAPQLSDTQVALMAQILQSWGAKTEIVNQTGDPAAVRVILAGDAEVGSIAVTTAINSGLLIFGPSQPRLAYDFIGAPSLKTIADLPGHVYGTSNTHGLEALMFADLMAKNHINPSSVKVTLAGGSSVRVAAMLTHHIDATFVHSDDVAQLLHAGFNNLATMSQAAPQLADSFMAGSPGWVSAHPDLAAAVNEAWIKAAQIFNNDEAQWVTAAVKYAGGSTAAAEAAYHVLLQANTWPTDKNAFTAASASAQENLAAQVGAINSKPSLATWFTDTYWNQATKARNIA